MKVTVDEIRERFLAMTERRVAFEAKIDQPSKLLRHEMWRHAYLTNPYLIGAPSERVSDRFNHVFMNVMEVDSTGRLSPVPISQTDEFIQSFTHLLEEYGSRSGDLPPDEVIQKAQEPFRKYFANGTPSAVAMFENYPIIDAPVVVKYGRREHLEPMLAEGRIRLANAASYNDDNLLDAVRDNETSRTFYLPTFRERLLGKTHIDFQGKRFYFHDDDIVLPLVFDDYYLFCLCDRIHYRMPTDFDADTALIIRDPQRFIQALVAAFLIHHPGWLPMAGPVTYYDPYQDYTKFRVPEMAKHFGYSYQREMRIAFRPANRSMTALEPFFLSVGPMTEYADIVGIR